MESTWESRDLPVLDAIVKLSDRAVGGVGAEEITTESRLDPDSVQAALRAIRDADPPYIRGVEERENGAISAVGAPTSQARRAVGAWPSAEGMADRIVAAVNEAAEREEDPERKGWLRKTAAYLGNAGRDLAVEIGASVITRQLGGMG